MTDPGYNRARRAALSLSLSLAGIVLVALGTSPASAQTFDAERYEWLRDECASFLRAAVAAREAGDNGRALVYHDLGSESCDEASAMVRDTGGALSDSEGQRLFARGLALDAELGDMLLTLDDCDGADALLRASASLGQRLSDDGAAALAPVYHRLWDCLGDDGGSAARIEVSAATGDLMVEASAFGDVPAESVVYGCRGWLPDSPSLLVEVLDATWLSVVVSGQDDQLLLAGVDGPGGSYCAYAAPGTNIAAYERDVEPGTYRFYLGHVNPSIARSSVTVSVQTVDTAALRARPPLGSREVGPDTAVMSLSAVAEGAQSAATIEPSCMGFVSDTPSLEVRLSEDGPLWLAVSTKGPGHAAVVVLGEDRTLCRSAPSEGGPAVVSEVLPRGRYQVLVAAPSDAPTPYVLTFGSSAPPPAASAEHGRVADVSLDSAAPLRTFEVESIGNRAAEVDLGVGCAGLVGALADLRVDVTEAGNYAFMAMASDEADISLGLVGPSEVWCSDDFAGLNPGLFLDLEPGTYWLFVGRWGRGTSATVSIGPGR